MSLTIYTTEEEVKKAGLELIRINDVYFDSYTDLQDTPFFRHVLSEIDQAEYVSSKTFLGRNKEFGALYKKYLSTGTKTLLNIAAHGNVCFDVCECGKNALNLLPFITDGFILWASPCTVYLGDGKCDMLYKGKRYTDFNVLLSFALKEGV